MKVPCPAILCLLLSLAATPAHAQGGRPDVDAIGSSLKDLLTMTTFGMVTTQDQAAEVTRRGADYLVRLPLRGFSVPADAALSAVARPLGVGMWDIASMTVPSAGTVEAAMPNAGTSQVAFSLGEQATHGEVDPKFAHPSFFASNLGGVRLRSDQGDRRTEQTLKHYAVNGTLSADSAGQLNFASRNEATDWHLIAHAPNGVDTDSSARSLSGRFSVDGLNRAKGTRLLAAAHALMASARPPAPGQPRNISPAQRQELNAMVDAVSGLLTRFKAEETLNDIRFTLGPANSGSIGRMHLNMTGDAADERLDARLNVAMDELAISLVPPDMVAFVPHHIDVAPMMAGVRTGPLLALLRAAIAPSADPGALQARFMALSGDANARIGIKSLSFDSGPMRVMGSARVVPRASGQFGADIHLSATGVDALIARAQRTPALRQALPIIFIAKGIGRPEGGALVWDITLGDGAVTVNGIPFGQPLARRR